MGLLARWRQEHERERNRRAAAGTSTTDDVDREFFDQMWASKRILPPFDSKYSKARRRYANALMALVAY